MSLRAVLIGGSLLAHGVAVVALGALRAPEAISATAIEVVETTKPEPPPPAKVEPPPEPVVPHDPPPRAQRAAKAAAESPPPPDAPAPAPNALAALPDLGLELSGGSGPGGMAVPPASPTPRAAPMTKTLSAAPVPRRVQDACDEPPAKPKLVKLPQPAYTDAARAAGIEGKVRLEIVVDETGKVVEVKPLTSLGHGLDEAAIAAARAATFEPAQRCGRPSRSTFTIAIRFAAS
jgi:periplasmic protein TonB